MPSPLARIATVLCFAAILGASVVGIVRVLFPLEATKSEQASRERLQRAALQTLYGIWQRQQNRPYDDWPECEKIAYRNACRTLHELGSSVPSAGEEERLNEGKTIPNYTRRGRIDTSPERQRRAWCPSLALRASVKLTRAQHRID